MASSRTNNRSAAPARRAVSKSAASIPKAVYNSGFATPASDQFVDSLASALPVSIVRRIAAFDRVGSTNRVAREIALHGPSDLDIVVAEQQSAGRGRLGRTWYSERGNSLVCSFIIRIAREHAGAAMLPVMAAVAAAEAVEDATGMPTVDIKWPNDLAFERRKFAGILIESTGGPAGRTAFVVGIGVNVGSMMFPSDVGGCPTTLHEVFDSSVTPTAVLLRLVRRIDACRADLDTEDRRRTIIERYRGRLVGVGEAVAYRRTADAAPVCGTIEGVADDGSLLLATETGVLAFHAGDITTNPA